MAKLKAQGLGGEGFEKTTMSHGIKPIPTYDIGTYHKENHGEGIQRKGANLAGNMGGGMGATLGLPNPFDATGRGSRDYGEWFKTQPEGTLASR